MMEDILTYPANNSKGCWQVQCNAANRVAALNIRLVYRCLAQCVSSTSQVCQDEAFVADYRSRVKNSYKKAAL